MKELNRWFKPKPYIHISKKIHKQDFAWLNTYLNDDLLIAKHAFLPLIHRILFKRRFRRNDDRSKKLRVKLPPKPRHIYYATHIDAHIYASYANRLNCLYQKELDNDSQLSSSVIAYRRIPKINCKGYKSNIEFAHEVFNFIKTNNQECVALTFDVQNFFDDLDHQLLKRAWCKLIRKSHLPEDHFNVYKSLTDFRFIDETDLLKAYGFKHRNDLRRAKINSLGSMYDFRKNFVDTNVIRRNTRKNSKEKIVGIPQGTALSAFLSNLYLLEFDKDVLTFLESFELKLYRRYSDDIVIVCPESER